jgi:hypothetical protein
VPSLPLNCFTLLRPMQGSAMDAAGTLTLGAIRPLPSGLLTLSCYPTAACNLLARIEISTRASGGGKKDGAWRGVELPQGGSSPDVVPSLCLAALSTQKKRRNDNVSPTLRKWITGLTIGIVTVEGCLVPPFGGVRFGAGLASDPASKTKLQMASASAAVQESICECSETSQAWSTISPDSGL